MKRLALLLALHCSFGAYQSTNNDNRSEPCLTIGAIAKGRGPVDVTAYTEREIKVAVHWYYINTDEIYQILRTVHYLDLDPEIDIILLFDHPATLDAMPGILATTNKRLIRYGATHRGDTESGQIDPPTNADTGLSPTELCGDEAIPDLVLSDIYCQQEHNETVDDTNTTSVNEPLRVTDAIPKAMTHLVKSLQWKTVTILYETSTELEASDLVDQLSGARVMFSMFNVDQLTSVQEFLTKVYFAQVPTTRRLSFLVLCKFNCARNILRTANSFDRINTHRQKKTLLKQFSTWLVGVYGHSKGVAKALQACADDLDNVAVVAIPEFIGIKKQEFERQLESVMFDLILYKDFGGTMSDASFLETQIEHSAITLDPLTQCTGYYVETLLWTDNGRRFSPVGYMTNRGGIVLDSHLFPNTRYGYNKRTFLVATLPYAPFVYRDYVNGSAVYSGFCIDLLDQLAVTLNFTYEMTEPEDQMWGGLVNPANNTYNGLIGLLQRKEIDMTAAPLFITSRREQAVDFAYPFFYEYTTVVTKKPDGDATKWRTLLDPFKWQVLLYIAISLPLVTTVVCFIERYNPYYNTRVHAEIRQQNGGLHMWASSFWYIYGALLCQGGLHLPSSVAGRTLVSFWWIFCIIVVGTYSGNLIAFLTVTKEKVPFNTLEEMVNQKGDYKWGTLAGTNWENIFTTSSNRHFHAIGEGLREFNKTDPDIMNIDPDVHIDKVLQGGYAWIGDKTYIEAQMATECDLVKIKEEFLPLNYGFGFQNLSPHKQAFSEQMMKIHEGGLLQIWKRKWWPKANFCADKSKITGAKPISVIDVQSAFYVCLIGIFMGSVAFAVENGLNRYQVSRERIRRVSKTTSQLEIPNGNARTENDYKAHETT